MPCAITVLEKEQDMDFIFGLDMLRRHQCQIDLKDNVLRLGTIEKAIPFYTLVPIRPRSRGERRFLRTSPGDSLRPPLAFNTRPRRLSTPTDAFQLHPDVRSYGTALRRFRSWARASCRRSRRRWASRSRRRRREGRRRRRRRRRRRAVVVVSAAAAAARRRRRRQLAAAAAATRRGRGRN